MQVRTNEVSTYTKRLGSLLLVATLLSSCATVFTGTRDPILFTSDPPGATVLIDDDEIGTTPILLDVRRNIGQRWVTIEMEGYETEHRKLDKKFNFVSVINLTYPIFWLIDVASGSIFKYKDRMVQFDLEPSLDRPMPADTIR